MKNKLYILIHGVSSDSNELISLINGIQVILSFLRSEPYSLESLRLIILKSNKIISDKPIYEDFVGEDLLFNNNLDLGKSFQQIIDHIKSEPKDRIYPTVICFSFNKSNDDFSKELRELNKISQCVNLITNNENYNYYKQFGLLDRENNSSTGFAKLDLVETIDVNFIKDIFKYMYVGLEAEAVNDSLELPPPPLEVLDETELRERVGEIFKDINISPMIIICSKACKESPKEIEWLMIPEKENGISSINRQIIIDHIKTFYDSRLFSIMYYYLLRIDMNFRFIFEYGRIDSSEFSLQNNMQPTIILKDSNYLSEFIYTIFKNIEKYPPNKLCWD